ncbi:hypothetical protein [Pusillimonas noertemannii]|uniref:Cofactor-independent phosphoglycerate mutase n=1 Tax=Pusillimonas noertemannii TaxID=305977 RepID=A0A2U1CHE6_9BURK|nr:hypothetical protein [Pusillimonas noertemannii]NYT70219.1 hypothetical protein [Pusillimonas noertemannii]PVY60325.1 hypothetical protein C7440_3761 [Pusillimonas noertemannii]TFL08134.1 hypothetical protein CSC72_18955 [Pusillimonas noertemannii]
MHIVLPGALPDPEAARALLPHLHETAPTFTGWLSRSRARLRTVDPAVSACTAFEHWQLERAGFQPDAKQNLSAGLGPLWAQDRSIAPDQPVWLAELVHMAPTQTSTAMLASDVLRITPDQSVALFESAQTLFEGTGFQLHHDGDRRWRIEAPASFALHSASPALVAATSVNDWWPQQEAARPWRRLVNEIQMLWFGHPVNASRQNQGLPPVNGLWLFGGGRAEQLRNAALPEQAPCYEALQAPFMAQDWAGWLAALAELEAQVFLPLRQQGMQPVLVLAGRNQLATLEPRTLARWTQWLPGSRNTWSKWWSYRN